MAMDDICRFLPSEENDRGLTFHHFVYEASYKRLRQPFVHSNYYFHLAFKGSAKLKTEGREYTITPGTVFVTFPQQLYTLEGDSTFTYLYVSYNGTDAAFLMKRFHISRESCVFPDMGHLLEFWMDSIRRVNDFNAAALTESVLLYSLSYINTPANTEAQNSDRFEKIISFIHSNYADPDLSLAKVADMFFYSKKYLSTLFVKKTNSRFSEYLNNLRLLRAETIMKQQDLSISEISAKCGFSNPYYFSKVFKGARGCTPLEYMKQHGPNAEA